MQHDRRDMTSERNFIEELSSRVLEGKKAGKSIPDLQRTITVASLRSLNTDGYYGIPRTRWRCGTASAIASKTCTIGWRRSPLPAPSRICEKYPGIRSRLRTNTVDVEGALSIP